jgi:hypothetical protein
MKELVPKLRQPFFSWTTELAVAMMSVMSGAPSAEQAVLTAFQIGTAGGQPDAKLAYISQLSVIRRDQGRHAEMIESLRGFADTLLHLPVWRLTLAGLYCETDQLDKARAQIGKLASCDFNISLDWTWASSVINLAQVCSDLEDRELARLYYPELRSVAGQVGVTANNLVCYGSLAFPCGQLASCLQRWREAEEYFDEAMVMNARLSARPYLVRTRRAYSKMLLDRDLPGDRSRAARLIEEGHAEAEELGMKREIDRLDRLCRRMSTTC